MGMTERQMVAALMNDGADPEFYRWWNEKMEPSGVAQHPSYGLIKGAAEIAWHEAMLRYGVNRGK